MFRLDFKHYIRTFKRLQKTTHSESGFTLVEILIVVVLIAILVVLALLALNPTDLRERLYDVNRKRDLNNLHGLYEVFYNQNFRYPTGAEICYDTPTEENGVCSCQICGLESDNNPFTDILQAMYCDPQHPRFSYVYEYDCSADPMWYRMYARLSRPNPEAGDSCSYGITNKDPSFLEPYPFTCEEESGGSSGGGSGSGGGGGGGPTATPTPTPTQCPADPVPKYCILSGICNICGTFAECQVAGACDNPNLLYSNSNCTQACVAP